MGQRVKILHNKLPIFRQCTDFLKQQENVTADEETENLGKEVEENARQVAKLQEELKNMKKKLNEDKDEMPTEEDESSSQEDGVLTMENIEEKKKEADERVRNGTRVLKIVSRTIFKNCFQDNCPHEKLSPERF